MTTNNYFNNNILNNKLEAIVKSYKDKYAYESFDGKVYYKKNDLSNNSHVNHDFENGRDVETRFIWPGEKLGKGRYKLSELTWENLIAGQTMKLIFSKEYGTDYSLLHSIDTTYSAYSTMSVFNKHDWEYVKNQLIDNFGEDIIIYLGYNSIAPVNDKFENDRKKHNEAMAEYMENEIRLGHDVD